MNQDKFTLKSQEAINNALFLAQKYSHQSILPEHLTFSLLDDAQSQARTILINLGIQLDDLVLKVKGFIEDQPKVQGAGANLGMSQRLAKILNEASSFSNKFKDEFKKFQQVQLSPRWVAANVDEAEVRVGYEASDGFLKYDYVQRNQHIFIAVESSGADLNCHILVPEGMIGNTVVVNGKAVDFENELIEKSRYVNFFASAKNTASIIIKLAKE